MTKELPRCPICGAHAPADAAAARKYAPFCSSRCQLIDLGNWLGERYVVPAGPADDPDRTPDPEAVSDGGGDPTHDKGSR
jgi:uncharacterized protein